MDEIFGFSGVIYGFWTKESFLSMRMTGTDSNENSSNSLNTNNIMQCLHLAFSVWHIPCLKNGNVGSTIFRNERFRKYRKVVLQ